MSFKLLLVDDWAITSDAMPDSCEIPQIVEAIQEYDAELERIQDYTGAVSDERTLLILELLERDDKEEGRNIRVAEFIGVGGKNVSNKINAITRRAREIRRSRQTS